MDHSTNTTDAEFLGLNEPVITTTSLLYTTIAAHPLIVLATCLLMTAIVTRLISVQKAQDPTGHNGAKTIPAVPYYFPILGHIPNMAWDAAAFTRNLRDYYRGQGVFSLNFGGTVHNVLFNPKLATAMLSTKPENAEADNVFKTIMNNVFGWPMSTEGDKYDAALDEINGLYKYLQAGTSLSEMVVRTAGSVKDSIASFVTFNESLVDQMLWERSADAKVKTNANGEKMMEADLLELVRDWCSVTANPSIIGSDFVQNFPEFFTNIWILDKAFLLLATGLPRWVPVPLLLKGHIARKNVLDMIEQFERALEKWSNGEDPGVEWQNLEDVGPVIQDRLQIYKKYNFSMRARAATDHALMWAANANSNSLVFWMLERIYADKTLLSMLREEIEPYVKAVQPKQEFTVPEMPRLQSFDVEGLCASCPLLKSCYIECLRLDAATWSLKVVRQDFVLTAREKDAQSWQLRQGQYVHVAHDLYNTDPKAFEHPDVWKADRHVKYDGEKRMSADMGSMRPYGGGHNMCKGRAFAFKECMMFAAAIIAFWDVEPIHGGDWKMPKHRKATGVYGTNDSTRVWIKRRELPQM